jgi:cytochrome c oxidase subunit 1
MPMWEEGETFPVAEGLRTDKRETLITTALDAVPDSRHSLPGESVWPLIMAIAVAFTFIVAIYTPWAYPIGFAFGIIAFAGWGWPRGEHPEKQVTTGRIPRTEAEAS